jgi:hypothetical protein
VSNYITDPAERMAHARAAMRGKFVGEAREQFARLGIEPTEEQVEEAGNRLLKKAQQDRMATARAARHTPEQKRSRNLDWAVRQVHTYATLLHTWAPQVPDSEQTRICLMAVGDELRSPDGFNRKRLIRRLQALVDHVKEQAQQRSAVLDATLREPVDFDELPSLDDIAKSLGEPTWSGLTDEDVNGG